MQQTLTPTQSPANNIARMKEVEPQFLEAALNVIANRTTHTMVAAEVDKYQTAILKSRPWYTSPEHGEVERVTNHDRAWLMTDADALLYYSLCNSAAHAAGYRMPKGNCPELTMDTKLREAENALIDVHAPITGLTSQLAAAHPHIRTQALEHALNLAGGRPGFNTEAAMPIAINLIWELKTDKA